MVKGYTDGYTDHYPGTTRKITQRTTLTKDYVVSSVVDKLTERQQVILTDNGLFVVDDVADNVADNVAEKVRRN